MSSGTKIIGFGASIVNAGSLSVGFHMARILKKNSETVMSCNELTADQWTHFLHRQNLRTAWQYVHELTPEQVRKLREASIDEFGEHWLTEIWMD